MYRKLVSLLLLVCFASYLANCTSMRSISKEEISKLELESSVWVTMADGSRYEMKEPKVEDSKLVGYVEGEGYKEVDLSEIDSLGTKEPDSGKTALLVFAGVAGAVVLSLFLYDALFCDT